MEIKEIIFIDRDSKGKSRQQYCVYFNTMETFLFPYKLPKSFSKEKAEEELRNVFMKFFSIYYGYCEFGNNELIYIQYPFNLTDAEYINFGGYKFPSIIFKETLKVYEEERKRGLTD